MHRLILGIALVVLANTQLQAELVGVDFDIAGGTAPTNWTLISGAGIYANLIDESGGTTAVQLSVNVGSPSAVSATLTEVPLHSNPLFNIGGNLSQSGATFEAVFSGLLQNTEYAVWVFGLRDASLTTKLNQDVTITGAGSPITFGQVGARDTDQLYVNGELGNSSATMQSYAEYVTSTSNGIITIDVAPVIGGGATPFTVAGLAIQQVPEPSTIAMWGVVGLIGAFVGWRRRKQA